MRGEIGPHRMRYLGPDRPTRSSPRWRSFPVNGILPRGRPGTPKVTMQLAELLDRLSGEQALRHRLKPSRREQQAELRGAAYRLNEALRDDSHG